MWKFNKTLLTRIASHILPLTKERGTDLSIYFYKKVYLVSMCKYAIKPGLWSLVP